MKRIERISTREVIFGILAVALIGFEVFNFGTTKEALESLIGGWMAVVLASSFCIIDFAGLAHIFTEDKESKSAMYLMGAWLIGATLNAMMTWWAVTLSLIETPAGNAVLSDEFLLKTVPIFVAFMVWMVRVLFIAALVASEKKHQNHNRGVKSSSHAPQERKDDREY